MKYDPNKIGEQTSVHETREMFLENLKAAVRKAISGEMAEEFIRDKAWYEVYTDEFLIQMVRDLMALKLGQQVIKYPKNWKEALKEHFFKDWMKRKWPVKYKVCDAYIVFPEYLKEHHLKPGQFPSKIWYYAFKESDE